MARILTLDIETKPGLAYVWGLFDQTIGLSQLVSPSAPICVAAKFLGENEVHFYSDWTDGHEEMIKSIHKLISQADAVVGYNSDSFDLKKLRGEFVLHDLGLPPQPASIDLLKTVKKLGYQSNKLAFIGPFLKIGSKVKNEGFELWTKVIDGDETAQKRMQRYCIGDVRMTERLYVKLRPYIVNHPFMGDHGKGECGACGSTTLQSRGYRTTKAFKIQRIQCTSCGSWQDGVRTKI